MPFIGIFQLFRQVSRRNSKLVKILAELDKNSDELDREFARVRLLFFGSKSVV